VIDMRTAGVNDVVDRVKWSFFDTQVFVDQATYIRVILIVIGEFNISTIPLT